VAQKEMFLHRNFQGLLINLSPIKLEILISKSYLVADNLLFLQWDIKISGFIGAMFTNNP